MKRVSIADTTDRWNVGTVYCLGRNYAEHAREMGAGGGDPPVVFIKPAAALIDAGQPIILPGYSTDVHHEVELVLAIGGGFQAGYPPTPLTLEEADRAIIGFTIGLDLTLRDLQSEAKKAGKPWAESKGFPGSAPIGPIVLRQPEHRFDEMTVSLEVNGEQRQRGAVKEMIFDPAAAVEQLSRRFPIEEGDLIFTGTPAGVGPLTPGDRLVAQLDPVLTIEMAIAK